MMKYLLGTVFAALLLAPLAFTSNADQGKSNDSAIAHCGSCGKGKKCKEGCDCKKCKEAAKKKDGAKDEALLAQCKGCGKKKKGADKDEEALLFAA